MGQRKLRGEARAHLHWSKFVILQAACFIVDVFEKEEALITFSTGHLMCMVTGGLESWTNPAQCMGHAQSSTRAMNLNVVSALGGKAVLERLKPFEKLRKLVASGTGADPFHQVI